MFNSNKISHCVMGFINQFSKNYYHWLQQPSTERKPDISEKFEFLWSIPKKKPVLVICHGWFKHPSSFNFNFTLTLVIFPSSYWFFNFQFSDNSWQDRPLCYVVSLPQFSLGGVSINFFDLQQLFRPLFCQPQRLHGFQKKLRSRYGLYKCFDSKTTLKSVHFSLI